MTVFNVNNIAYFPH